MYTQIPHWSDSAVIANFYTLCMWHYCIPALMTTVLYVYLTLTLPRPPAFDCPDSPTNDTARITMSGSSPKSRRTVVGDKSSIEKSSLAEQSRLPPIFTRRLQPTFPRAPSTISIGMTADDRQSEAGDIERMSKISSAYASRVPLITLVRGHSVVRKWVGETTSAQEWIKAPPPSVASNVTRKSEIIERKAKASGPISQSMSWLEIDEQDEQD